MAKLSSINKNNRRKDLSKKFSAKREALKKITSDRSLSLQERIEATIKLSTLPRNSSQTRVRNRCNLTGRPHAYYRKLGLSRIALRELGSSGLIPGLTKSSW